MTSISIHALREEGDRQLKRAYTVEEAFLSTPSARRATHGLDGTGRSRNISIHALREEGDCAASCIFFEQLLFLSTPSARRATFALPCA